MAKVYNAVEILPKIWTAWVGRTNVTDVTDDRQTTDGRQHIANVNVSSRSLKMTYMGVNGENNKLTPVPIYNRK